MSEPLILAFDSSGPYCAAALLAGDTIVAQNVEEMTKGQAERLMGLLDDTLAQGGASWPELTALGVGIGPGNFTGIRIAVSAARGLALSLGVEAIGVNSLEAIALSAPRTRPVVALVDARGGQVYAAGFRPDGSPMGQIALGTTDSVQAGFDPTAFDVTGFGAEQIAVAKHGTALPFALADLAPTIARIAASRLGQNAPRPAPLYIRAPDAAPPRDPAPVILD